MSQSSPVNTFADTSTSATEQALLERRARLLGPTYRAFYRNPIHLVRGSGVWLYDAGGRKFLDAYNNVASVGHCHPRVVEALSGQAATLNTHTRYLSEIILDYAEAQHPHRAVISRWVEGAIHRTTYAEIHGRARRLAKRLERIDLYRLEYSSREKLTMPGLDITLFNDKWEFKFAHDMAEALMLFVGEYGQEAMQERH